MAKGQTQRGTGMANQNYQQANSQGAKTQGYLWDQLPGATQQAQQTYGQSSGAYGSFLGGSGAYDPGQFNTQYSQNQSNINSGGYDPATLAALKSQQQSNINTGGYDPSKMSELTAGYRNLTSNGMGGIDPTQAAKVRGGYESMATTGGISDTEAGAMERKAASGVQGTYATLGQNLARQSRAQGITAGGETAQMARQGSSEEAKAVTGAEAGIAGMRQTGRIAGLGGLSSFEQGAAGAQREALGGQSALAGSEAQGRLSATAGAASTAASEAQGRLSASAANQELISGAAQQKIQAAGGLAALYNSSPGYVNSLVGQIMQSQYQTGQLTSQQAQIMTELSKNPGLFSSIMQGLGGMGQLAGGVGGLLSGIGGL